jgi:hypothetical protein
VQCEVLDTTVFLHYIHNWVLVKLWHCDFRIQWSQWIVSNFYTANLSGVDETFKLRASFSDYIHILKSPIKYIWKEIFSKILDICRKNNITSIKLIPLKITNSVLFYNKMIDYYPEYIEHVSCDEQWDMLFLLK